MANIHLIMQGKGGVGKSLVAYLLAQYVTAQSGLPLCLDLDPVNASFHAFKALQVQTITLMAGDAINATYFDQLTQLVCEHPGEVVIDSGASSFLPLFNYLVEHEVAALWQARGHRLIVHTVVTGGPAGLDTISSFAKLAEHFAAFVLWLNPFFGPLVYTGKTFTELKVYQQYYAKLLGLITLPTLQAETFGHDLQQALQDGLTFAEVEQDSARLFIVQHRLKRLKQKIFAQLAEARI